MGGGGGGAGGGGGGGEVEGLGGKLPLNEVLHVVLIYKTPLTFSAVVDTMNWVLTYKLTN